jgi:hypothetical protein
MSGLMYAPKGGGAPDVVLYHRQAQGVSSPYGSNNSYNPVTMNYIDRDPKGLLLSLTGDVFQFRKDGYIEFSSPPGASGTTFYRLCRNNVNGPLHDFSQATSARSFGTRFVKAEFFYIIAARPTTAEFGNPLGAAGNQGFEMYHSVKYWAD